MRTSLLSLLQCPAGCPPDLVLRAARSEGAEEVDCGTLACAGCGREYPIEEGIPRLLPETLATGPPAGAEPKAAAPPDDASRRKRREMRARDEQAGDYDRMWHLSLFGRVEVPLTLSYLRLRPEHALLEAGCGTGRMTREFATRCARLVSVDFSWESLRACAAKLRRAGARNVDLVQADICRLPLRARAFDRVTSCQVLEHIPTPESRESAVRELARVLRPGGNLALSAYQYSLLMRLWGEKEGEHAGGIYFYRFGRREFRDLLSRALTVEAVTGALVYHYLARCRKEEA